MLLTITLRSANCKFLAVRFYLALTKKWKVRIISLKKQCKQSKNLTLVKTFITSTNTLKKRMQNIDIFEIINMERQDIFH